MFDALSGSEKWVEPKGQEMMEYVAAKRLWLFVFLSPLLLVPMAHGIIVQIVEVIGPIAPPGFPDCVDPFLGPDLECQLTDEWQAYARTEAYRALQRELGAMRQDVEFSGRAWLANAGGDYNSLAAVGYIPSVVMVVVGVTRYWHVFSRPTTVSLALVALLAMAIHFHLVAFTFWAM